MGQYVITGTYDYIIFYNRKKHEYIGFANPFLYTHKKPHIAD